MTSELEEIRVNLSNLPDVELRQIANAPLSEYRREAIEFARQELRRRGIEWSGGGIHRSSASTGPHRAWRTLVRRATTDWSHLSRRVARTLTLPLAAVLIFVAMQQSPILSRGKTGICLLTTAFDFIGLSYLDVFRKWRVQTPTDKIRAVDVTIIAIVATI